MRDLKISIVQCSLQWEDPEKNRANLLDIIDTADIDQSDVLILPEMFTTGFSMNTTFAEEHPGETVRWMKSLARHRNFAVCGSIMARDGQHVFNRLYFVTPEGGVHWYNKRHLFRMAGEHHHFTAGDQRVVVQYRDWDICLQVCYDLRFPVFSRNRNDYHLLLYVANWPEPRTAAWSALLRARAIENYCYTVGVNRIGSDGSAKEYIGGTEVFDFKGESILRCADGNQEVRSVTLRKLDLVSYREKFPVWLDSDDFSLSLH
jgi:predicted amidohydrolase